MQQPRGWGNACPGTREDQGTLTEQLITLSSVLQIYEANKDSNPYCGVMIFFFGLQMAEYRLQLSVLPPPPTKK